MCTCHAGDALGDDYDMEEDDGEGSDGEDDGDGEDEEGDEGRSKLDKRRMQAAAGNHPLQVRGAAGGLGARGGREYKRGRRRGEIGGGGARGAGGRGLSGAWGTFRPPFLSACLRRTNLVLCLAQYDGSSS